MYIRDEHPMRNRLRYYAARGGGSMQGMGIGPEIRVPQGCNIELQMSSPSMPLAGLMEAMTDTYTTLVPTMAPLSNRPDFGPYAPNERQFAIEPVEMGAEVADLAPAAATPPTPQAAMSGYAFDERLRQMQRMQRMRGMRGNVRQQSPEPQPPPLLRGFGQYDADERLGKRTYTADELIQRMSVGLAGYGRHGGAASQGQSSEWYGVGFGTCLGCR